MVTVSQPPLRVAHLLLRGKQAVQRCSRGKQAVQVVEHCAMAPITNAHLAVQLGTLSNCCAAAATFFMCKLPWLSSRAASSAQCVLKAASSPRVDSKNLLTSAQATLCTVTRESRPRSNINSSFLSHVVLTFRKSNELVVVSSSILAGCATLLIKQSDSWRQLWAAASRAIASNVRVRLFH